MRASDLKVQKKKRRKSEGRDSDGCDKKIMERKKRYREKKSGNCERWIKQKKREIEAIVKRDVMGDEAKQ